ncbi:MAG: peptidylprolyl isomerase [Bacillaceae bacterium]|nr:peptidylprolyl isomerase [Bacillaceae bacterium]
MKKLLLFLLFLTSTFIFTACSKSDNKTEAVSASMIGSEIVVETTAGNITKEELYEELLARFGEQVLQEMITFKVLNDRYEVDEKLIDKEVDMIKNQYGERFALWLEYYNFKDEDAFRDAVRLTLLQDVAKADGVEISDENIRQRYERLIMEVNAQHILVVEEDLAIELKEKLDNGADFSELAKEYSIDSSNALDGGELGYFTSGTMVLPFEIAAFALEVGEVSEPVETQFGFHLIKVLDKKEIQGISGTLEEKRDEIKQLLINEKFEIIEAQKKIAELLEGELIRIHIEGIEDIFNLEKINFEINSLDKGRGGKWN